METKLTEQIEIKIDNESVTVEKIIDFFEKKQLNHKEIVKSSKKNFFNVQLYQSNDLFSILQCIKDEKIDAKEGFVIYYNASSDYFKISRELLKKEIKKNVINYQIPYENICKIDYIRQIGEDGIEFIDQETIDKQRSVVTYMINKIGSNLLTGQSIMNTSLPIKIFDERSLLDANMYKFRLSTNFLKAAADSSSSLERLKQVTSFIFTNLHLNCAMSKPFNPILGETFQCKINDSLCYCEQTSHHPPIMNFYIKNPKYLIFGNENVVATTSTNSFSAVVNGKYFIRFKDGVTITYSYPNFGLNGVLIGKRKMNWVGNLIVNDLTNNLIACIRINPTKSGFFSKLFSGKNNYPDYTVGFICNTSNVQYDSSTSSYKCDKKHTLSSIEGEWTNYIKFDDVYYWKHSETKLDEMEKQEFTLPSDSLYRDDLLLFKEGNLDLSQQAKTNLEETQRKDRKLREKDTSHK